MFEQQVEEVKKKLNDAIALVSKDQEAGLASLSEITKQVGEIIPMESTEYYEMASIAYEIASDFYVRAKKPLEAEEFLKNMLRCATELLKRDEEKYDYRVATAYYKLGALGKLCLGMVEPSAKAVSLPEKENEIFKVIITYFKMAMKASMAKAKEGQVRSLEMHATCLDQMSVMHACVGNYKEAIEDEDNAIKIDKAIYEKYDDLVHAMRLAFRMNNLSMYYNSVNQYDKVIEVIEDSLYVLNEHESEDPKQVKMVLGRHRMNLANAYACVKEEVANAPAMFRLGVSSIEEANELNDNEILYDVVMANFLAGKYFFVTSAMPDAKKYLKRACEAVRMYQVKTGLDNMDMFLKQSQAYLENIPDWVE